MESGAQLDQTGHLTFDSNGALFWIHSAVYNFQQRAFPAAVLTYKADSASFLYFKRYIFQGKELFVYAFAASDIWLNPCNTYKISVNFFCSFSKTT